MEKDSIRASMGGGGKDSVRVNRVEGGRKIV